MSTYVMSDIHGNYKAYINMLKKIDFKDSDMLYILGDILDRGSNPIKIILDLMERPNVEVIVGNHCVIAGECFSFLLEDITEETIDRIDEEIIEKLLNWQMNGGASTMDEFLKYDKPTQIAIVDFISNFKKYDEIEVSGKKFILVHAGLENFESDKELWEYELEELVWIRSDYELKYFDDKYVISGHTPTMLIENNTKPGFIYKANNNIAIDCGCSYPGGRLGCLRLDDMKEFYVDVDEI